MFKKKKKLVYAILLSVQISKGVEIVYVADGRGLTGGCLSDVSFNFQVHLSHAETSHPHSRGFFKRIKNKEGKSSAFYYNKAKLTQPASPHLWRNI